MAGKNNGLATTGNSSLKGGAEPGKVVVPEKVENGGGLAAPSQNAGGGLTTPAAGAELNGGTTENLDVSVVEKELGKAYRERAALANDTKDTLTRGLQRLNTAMMAKLDGDIEKIREASRCEFAAYLKQKEEAMGAEILESTPEEGSMAALLMSDASPEELIASLRELEG